MLSTCSHAAMMNSRASYSIMQIDDHDMLPYIISSMHCLLYDYNHQCARGYGARAWETVSVQQQYVSP